MFRKMPLSVNLGHPPRALSIRLVGYVTVTAAVLMLICAAHASGVGGASVVQLMHAKYANAWYDTMQFTQKSTTFEPDGSSKAEMWYERGLLPGKLRIDIGPAEDRNAMIMTDGTLYTFQRGALASTRALRSLALVLGFDVYVQSPDVTLTQLKQEGINVALYHDDVWQGKVVQVVGALKGDLRSKQFWVETDRLLCVRVIMPDSRSPDALADIRFLDYRQQTRGQIAARIEVHRGDRLVFSEDYTNIETGVPLNPTIFNPAHFVPANPLSLTP